MQNNINRLFKDAQVCHQKGQLEKARARYEEILQLQSSHALARLYLALIMQQAGQIQDAVLNARQAIKDMKEPDPNMLGNYGVIMKNAGHLQEAEQAYLEALNIDPDLLFVHANLASLQLITGKLEQAEKSFIQLAGKTEDPGPWLNLIRIAVARGEKDKAVKYLQRVHDISPKHSDIPFLRAKLSAMSKDDDATFEHLKQALTLHPAHMEAWRILQSLDPEVLDLDFIEELALNLAETKVQKAILLTTAVDICRKNLIWPPLAALEQLLTQALDKPLSKAPGIKASFTLLSANVPQRSHLRAAAATWQSLTASVQPMERILPKPRVNNQRITVAFLSSDLRSHAVGRVIAGLLESLPKDKIQWVAYNNRFSDDSDSRERIRLAFDRFVNIASLNDRELAMRMREDGIDVLIDLNGITGETRISVTAYRPCPVQMTWLGMPGTTGAAGDVDYLIGDPWITYKDNFDGFCEKIIQLPRSYMPCDHQPLDPGLAGTRKDHGLPEDKIVFCSFNQNYKLSPEAFNLWARVLHSVPDSVLWLSGTSEKLASQRKRYLKERGIDPSRLFMARFVPSHQEHVARISHADLILDNWPYNAHSTCIDALRAGVPVLTLPGQTFAARVAAGILDTAGLKNWIASSPDDYVQKAVEFAGQPVKNIKQSVYAQFWSSPMVDNTGLGKHLEAICLGVYDRAARGLQPEHMVLYRDNQLHPAEFDRDSKKSTRFPGSSSRSNILDHLLKGQKDARLHNLNILKIDIIGLDKPSLLLEAGLEFADKRLVEKGLVEKIIVRDTALGDGQQVSWHICKDPEMNSRLEPDVSWLSLFPRYSSWANVLKKDSTATTRMDDMERAGEISFVCLDSKGDEIIILENAQQIINNAVFLQIRTSPTPVYKGGASLWDLGKWLDGRGYVLHLLQNSTQRLFKPLGREERPYEAGNQLFQVEAVFTADPRSFSRMTATRLQNMAFLAHVLYQSHDLTMLAMHHLDMRDSGNRCDLYAKYLDIAGIDA